METKNNKKTKSALILSVLLILVSVAFLAGSTFAWFTDSATSKKNKIMVGNLDVKIEYAPYGAETDSSGNIVESAWTEIDESKSLFEAIDDTRWEPGHTEIAYLRIKNTGNLNLKYNISVNAFGDLSGGAEKSYTNVNNDSFKLSQFLVLNQIDSIDSSLGRSDYWLTSDKEDERMGQLTLSDNSISLAQNETKVLTLVLYIPTKIGNEANQMTSKRTAEGEPTLYFGITVEAVQAKGESDSFGDDYDLNA